MQRRFATHTKIGKPKIIDALHPAALEARSIYTKPAGRKPKGVLVSGFNSKKIGRTITKGKWKDMPIFTLTLEERKTCPRSCSLWLSCYGNKMHWSTRHQPGEFLEKSLEAELKVLQQRYPRGYVVRLHVLGDFYSVEYIELWRKWLHDFPALHVFGYTARTEMDPIGAKIKNMVVGNWDRFAVRSSELQIKNIPFSFTAKSEKETRNEIICPAQIGKTECCATCGLCWQTKKPIAFLEH